ncbi:cytochrome b/b6 domain-containing protein [Celeribacter sp. PS-C1]|uniref:cytochrome b/b6 domain-containing protein n=1 Tax=Celeribacter sp. PS-C1 TaxID=2820813 RepID=UPI001CA58E21|nr:cytochrome b/b6 domain-containing protein [Celeribacter sp. PS-C1]MBW6418396.1 cytochrome b/b6 domain-containing protein [Celeribacter sp. PS-C1]
MLSNTATRYGAAARFFHWSIALLILADIALGLIGENTPRTADTAARLQTLYSVHKTIGVVVLGLAVLRFVWAFTQPKPVPVHPERKAETVLAEAIHWMLYGAILIMPLSGWVMHSAETGFAPILWPFGQNLPFVPKSEDVAHMAGAVHGLSAWVIYLTVALHILGALKHAVIEKDGVLSRMLRGTEAGVAGGVGGESHASALPVGLAAVLWLAVVVFPFALPVKDHAETAAVTQMEQVELASELPTWTVEQGNLTITVTQMGAPVEGSFANWNVAIAYDEDTGTGEVTVTIDTTSLSLGTVTQQAQGPEFFNTEAYSTAIFTGDISRIDGASHEAVGTLTLIGKTVPVTLSFDLTLEGARATMSGTTTLDRREFEMGAGYEDEGTVGFGVEVTTELTAARQDVESDPS